MEEALLQNSTAPIQDDYSSVDTQTTDTLDNDIKKDVDELLNWGLKKKSGKRIKLSF